MESKALREYRVPDYPKKEDVQAQPSLLRKSVYKRWQKLYDLGVSGMLVAGLSLSGCDQKTKTNTIPTQGIEAAPNENPNSNQSNMVSPAKLVALVAPIFEHGEGRGTIGCIAAAPPAFLSEDEALVVIKEELAKYGIELNKEKVLLSDVLITPNVYGVPSESDKKYHDLLKSKFGIEKEYDKPTPLEIDFQDSNRDINVEYVSYEDYFILGGERSGSTAQNLDMKNVAKQVHDHINYDAKQGVYGVFYDPLIKNKFGDLLREEITAENRATYKNLIRSKKENYTEEEKRLEDSILKKSIEPAKELLRNQVKDFAKWLKEQGVI
jgi:hypothetical protein